MSDDESYLLEVAAVDREAFVLCLALGTLVAMRSDSWPLEAGIWTLGRPTFLRPVASGVVSPEVVAELEAVDELEALAKLAGRPVVDAALDQMMAAIRSRLSALKERPWRASWTHKPADGTMRGDPERPGPPHADSSILI
ncbi:hypothetical protein [Paludisphaera soli]|uniref:hypothetical protein n=1 Tax=Paludisphaera soli TaxID=2712865 RepID=UPI0013EC82DC|nr:hypothetical protein [Paludisphaera soli]